MSEAYLLLGSNQGQRNANLLRACEVIEQKCGAIAHKSSLYQTAAWGLTDQEDFINMAIALQTQLLPIDLLAVLKKIEKEIGRVDTIKWGPRVIDIDILFHGDKILYSDELTVPHAFIAQRRFTLEPLNEIAPHFIHPVLHKSISILLAECTDTSAVKKILHK